jgi:proline dehydrogenase
MPLLRSAFIALSQDARLRRFSESSALGRRMSSRFVAGMGIEDALRAAETLNRHGISATLDNLGESISNQQQAEAAADIYHRLLDAIVARRLEANVSVKLTQLGLEVDPDMAFSIAAKLVAHATSVNNFVRVDMEGSSLTQITIDMVKHLHAIPGHAGHVGVVIQSYLYRSETDIHALLVEKIRIRLCKGAYNEPASVAFPVKKDVDENYSKLMKVLVDSPVYHGLATHDEDLIQATIQYVRERKIDSSHFEFQMLYGVRRDLQKSLVEQGFRVRVYVPFGTEWYPYFMRRLAERPANVLFLAKNLLQS